MLENAGAVIVMWDRVVQTQQILHEFKDHLVRDN